jgi:hypothetical protein
VAQATIGEKMSSEKTLSAVMSTLLILLSGAIFVWTSDMTPGAELFPRIMAGGLALFGIVELTLMITRYWQEKHKNKQLQLTDPFTTRKSFLYMGAFFLLVILFFGALPYAGFALTSAVFMFVSMLLIGGKKALRKWFLALLVPAIIILAFQYGLDVRLPSFSMF